MEAQGLGDRVQVLAPVPMRDLVASLDGYDVGVVPYLPVGMNNMLCSPNKLFEYMAAGLAVICSDLPVLRAVVADADCGLLVPHGDHDGMVGALTTLCQDRALLARLRSNAFVAATRRYNAAHEEGRLLDIYASLVRVSGSHA